MRHIVKCHLLLFKDTGFNYNSTCRSLEILKYVIWAERTEYSMKYHMPCASIERFIINI